MSARAPLRLTRNRHGTFFFRFAVPEALHAVAGRQEVRLSLGTDTKQQATIFAMHLAADLPRLKSELRRMAQNNETAPENYFQQWRIELFKNQAMRQKISWLQDEIDELKMKMEGMRRASR